MSEPTLMLIRESIRQARQEEAQTRSLLTYLEAIAPRLHQAIHLPEHQPANALLEFVTRYVEHVPNFLESLEQLMREAKIFDHGKAILDIAAEFFIQPEAPLAQHHGLHALIDEAYFAHRLMEEINDRVLMSCGVPLTPMDMTLANIVVHDIIGESHANQLDLAVHFAIETLFDSGSLLGSALLAEFVTQHSRSGWHELLDQWPCLAGNSSIALCFADGAAPTERSSVH